MHEFDSEASHTAPRATNLLALLLVLAGCPGAPANDDDSATPSDDDDSTAAVEPLAEVLGVVNLTRLRQPGGTDYVDLSGAFGDFAGVDLALSSPTAYLSTFGAEAPLWRLDLGCWPLLPEGPGEVVDLYEYLPWDPEEQLFWDAGDRIAAGQYLSRRVVDALATGYQVDDPLSPGGAAWSPGSSVSFQTSGGSDIIDWASPATLVLPQDMELVQPLPGASLRSPAAHELTIAWNPKDDGATVTIVLLQGLGPAYLATVPDTGSHTIPASALHDELGPGVLELIVGRHLEGVAAHPQGDVIVRSRVEERAEVVLQDDLVLEPAHGSAGASVVVQLGWFTGSVEASTAMDFGPGITVQGVAPDASDPQRAAVTLQIAPDAEIGARTVVLGNGGESIERENAFTVLDLDPADDCAAADAVGDLGYGSWTSTTDGLSNTMASGYACLDWSLNGADAIYPLYLQAGRTVRVGAQMPEPADVALILLDDCGEPASAVACADEGFGGEPEELLFTPEADGRYYLVIDGYTAGGSGSPSSPFTLSIEAAAEASPVSPPWIVRGAAASEHLVLGETDWASGLGPGDVDAGSEISVQAASAVGDQLSVTLSATASAALGPRDLLIQSDGAVPLPSALFVSDLPANDSCADAEAWGPVALGSPLTGWAAGGTDTLSEVGCFDWESVGEEVVFALDLVQGQTVGAALDSPEDAQLYVLSDCAAPATACIEEASADDNFGSGLEEFSGWIVPATGRYWLVVDLFGEPLQPFWTYELSLSVQ